MTHKTKELITKQQLKAVLTYLPDMQLLSHQEIYTYAKRLHQACPENTPFIDFLKNHLQPEPSWSIWPDTSTFNEIHKQIQQAIRARKLSFIKHYFEFLFPDAPTNSQLEELLFIFESQSPNLVVNDRDIEAHQNKLHQYFNQLHQAGTILIDNGALIEVKKAYDGLLVAGLKWLLNVQNIQDYAASQALLTRLGFLHVAHGNLLSEATNTVLTLDNQTLAGNIRKLVHSVLSTLSPLAVEWFIRLPTETSWFMVQMRLAIPILIASGVIALGFGLISSLVAMPAVFELLMIIPLTYFGFFMASVYIEIRDYLYETSMNLLYWGEYNRPHFQVNQTLIDAFGKSLAKEVRDYYIKEFQKCDQVIAQIKTHIHQKNAIETEQADYLKMNSQARKHELLSEWFTLIALGQSTIIKKENIQEIVHKRVKLDSTLPPDICRKERETYLKATCKALYKNNKITPFFIRPVVDPKLRAVCQYERNKISKLHEIDDNLPKLKA